MIDLDMLRAAVRSNDQLADHPEISGSAVEMVMREFGVAESALNHVSTQRAMRGFVAAVRPDLAERWKNGEQIGRFMSEDDVNILSALGGMWIDGFSAALRVLKESP